jgi:glucose/arabinose dehydrogenase
LSGLWTERGHIMHPFAITSDGVLYVNSGSITNSCQEKDRTLESPGISPCPELGLHAGIWRYAAGKTGQAFSAAERYATGTRNVVALAVNQADGTLYATLHGRDHLGVHCTKSSRRALPAPGRLQSLPKRPTAPWVSRLVPMGRCTCPMT